MSRNSVRYLVLATCAAGLAGIGGTCSGGGVFVPPASKAPELAGNWSIINAASTASLGNMTVDAAGNLVQLNNNPDVQQFLGVVTLITDGQAVSIPGQRAYQARSSLLLSGRSLRMSISISVFDTREQIGSGLLTIDGVQSASGSDISGDYDFSASGGGLPRISNSALCRMTPG